MSRIRIARAVAVAIALVFPVAAHAQATNAPGAAATPAARTAAPAARTPAEAQLGEVTSWLRNLVSAQEGHYADHGTYTTDLVPLKMLPRQSRYGLPDSVWVQVVHAGGRSWIGMGGHRGLRGKSCVIYVGYLTDFPSVPRTRADSLAPTREGAAACDAP